MIPVKKQVDFLLGNVAVGQVILVQKLDLMVVAFARHASRHTACLVNPQCKHGGLSRDVDNCIWAV